MVSSSPAETAFLIARECSFFLFFHLITTATELAGDEAKRDRLLSPRPSVANRFLSSLGDTVKQLPGRNLTPSVRVVVTFACSGCLARRACYRRPGASDTW
eukprot:scaffold2801_cov266-Pinguiococcus_pyrenoidosus.AAC.7